MALNSSGGKVNRRPLADSYFPDQDCCCIELVERCLPALLGIVDLIVVVAVVVVAG